MHHVNGKILENDVIPLDSAKKTRRKTMETMENPSKRLTLHIWEIQQ
jgi:hypothetical protein